MGRILVVRQWYCARFFLVFYMFLIVFEVLQSFSVSWCLLLTVFQCFLSHVYLLFFLAFCLNLLEFFSVYSIFNWLFDLKIPDLFQNKWKINSNFTTKFITTKFILPQVLLPQVFSVFIYMYKSLMVCVLFYLFIHLYPWIFWC